jgi:C-terminal processing protease CtpA/Prc
MRRLSLALTCAALVVMSLAQGGNRDKAPDHQNPLDRDHQFDSGSGIALNKLKPIQIDNLVTLGRIWGFLKYHHPAVTSGKFHWDYELLRVLPNILDAPDHVTANIAMEKWIDSLEPLAPCKPCATLEKRELALRSELDWTTNKVLLGDSLSQKLREIYRARPSSGQQFYVSQAAGIGNPVFEHEPAYANIKYPDAGFQLLALYRFWNIVEYWAPDRDVVGEDWTGVLAEFIPRFGLAKSGEEYQRELMALIGMAHDGHANLWGSINVRPPVGACWIPVNLRFIENVPVVSELLSDANTSSAGGLRVGDVITELDGEPVSKLFENWAPYYAASNDAARWRDIARYMSRGACGKSKVKVRRAGQELELTPTRVPRTQGDFSLGTHGLPEPAFRLLSKDVAYLSLASVKAADAPHYVEQAAGTKGFIIDIRNYPSEFVVFALGSLLVDREMPFVRFTAGDLSNPGTFHWTHPLSLSPEKPHYSGRVVILVDELSMSQAEYTSMAFRAASGAVVVGSATSGADGNVSGFALPGGWKTMISGLGVFYPDKRPTQRIGIVPDVEVKPTIEGIREGRDEVLEEGLRQILGHDAPAGELENMYRRSTNVGPSSAQPSK